MGAWLDSKVGTGEVRPRLHPNQVGRGSSGWQAKPTCAERVTRVVAQAGPRRSWFFPKPEPEQPCVQMSKANSLGLEGGLGGNHGEGVPSPSSRATSQMGLA